MQRREIATELKRLRETVGLSLEEAARRAGLSIGGLSMLENGERTDPSYSTLAQLVYGGLVLNGTISLPK